VRHVSGAEQSIADLHEGDRLDLQREEDNAHDPRALLVLAATGKRLGYVPHTLVEDLGRLLVLGSGVEARVHRVNPAPAPVHQRLLVSIAADQVEGFKPLATPRYETLAPDATAIDFSHGAHVRLGREGNGT
jgi:hypothetical protein